MIFTVNSHYFTIQHWVVFLMKASYVFLWGPNWNFKVLSWALGRVWHQDWLTDWLTDRPSAVDCDFWQSKNHKILPTNFYVFHVIITTNRHFLIQHSPVVFCNRSTLCSLGGTNCFNRLILAFTYLTLFDYAGLVRMLALRWFTPLCYKQWNQPSIHRTRLIPQRYKTKRHMQL
jgi:hypothetical protein